MTYLSIAAIYQNEAPYLREWIEFHRLVGVECFFLYDNGSSDGHLEVLDPYLENGTVTRHDQSVFSLQQGAYEHCLRQHGAQSRWIAFIDTDEFLFSPAGSPLPEVLAAFEAFPGVGVNRATFGTAGHKEMPAGLVTESYPLAFRMRASVKSIVDPSRVEHYQNPHFFVYRDGDLAVDENGNPLESWFVDEPSYDRLRVNHYHTKSETEYRRKLKRERADTGIVPAPRDDIAELTGKVKDESIAIWLPALREALGRGAG